MIDEPGWMRRPAGYTAGLVVLALIYFITAKASLITALAHPVVTAVWAPAGISLAALILAGYRLWPAILVGAFFANADSTGILAAVGIAGGNTLAALLGAWTINRFASGRLAFRRAHDVLFWAVYAGLLASAVSATISILSLAATGNAPWPQFWELWLTHWIGHAGSVTVLAPAIVLWAGRARIDWNRKQLIEGLIFLVALLVVETVVFGVPVELGGDHRHPRAFIFFPLLAWAAFRLGSRATAAMLVVVAGLSLWATLRGQGPFATGVPNESLLLLQAFLITTSVTTLAIAAAVVERHRAQRQVGVLNAELQQRVSERTTALARSESLLAEARTLRARAEAEEERARFLAESSSLLAASLDYQTTLANLAKLAVPRMGDWCSIQLLMDDGAIQQIALAHVQPEKMSQVQALAERWPPNPASPYGAHEVIRTGEPQMMANIPDAMLVQAAQSDEHLAFLRSLDFSSYMIVPLIVRGHTLGAITFIGTTGRRPYDQADLALAVELANRAATAVENTRLFAKAQEAVRVREDFLAIASHELRTPVTSLRLQVQIVERALAEEVARANVTTDQARMTEGLDKVRALTRVLGEDSRRLMRLVNGLLDVTRIATGKLDLQPEDLDFRDIVQSGIDALRPELVTRKVSLAFDAPEPIPGRWDRLRMEQVIANLLSNALKYGAGAPITVRAAADGDWITLTVHDEGAGIAPEFRDRMFDRFEQGASGTQGLGLGLYITKQIVESHGGTIEETGRPGEGATFTVRLPRIAETSRRTPLKEDKP